MINTATTATMTCPDWCISTVHVDDSDHVGALVQLPALGQSDALGIAPSMTADGDIVILVSVEEGGEKKLTPGQARALVAALQNVLQRVDDALPA